MFSYTFFPVPQNVAINVQTRLRFVLTIFGAI